MQKTFKIGEEAIGGIITIREAGARAYKVECKNYYTKEVVRWTYIYSFAELVDYLEYVSTHYQSVCLNFFYRKILNNTFLYYICTPY